MIPTPQQRAVLDAIRDGSSNIAVNAVAGAGKTTTIVQGVKHAGPGCGFVAFNSHIAAAIKERLNGSAQASTLHSLGFRNLLRKFDGMTKEDRKVKQHIERLFPELHREGRGKWAGRKFLRDEWAGLPDAVSVVKQINILPSEDPETVESACWSREVEFPVGCDSKGKFFNLVEKTIEETLADTKACDFDDMLFMPVRLGLVRPDFRTLFVDETQDLSPIQQELAVGSGERIVIVGDPAQSIMGFAGADVRSFERMCNRLDSPRGFQQLPLSSCFRCPESHIALAQLLVPRIESGAFADEGDVSECIPPELIAGVRPGDMVLCRNTVPLIRLAMKLIANGIPMLVRGRAIGEDLETLLRQLAAPSVAELAYRLERWEADQIEKLEASDAPEFAVERIHDRVAGLKALIEPCQTIAEVERMLQKTFGDSTSVPVVLLSTIHRAKGLEADRVWLYEPGLIPSRAGEQQEMNLLYVALTRAKQSLFFVDDQVRRRLPAREWVAGVAAGNHRFDLTHKPVREVVT